MPTLFDKVYGVEAAAAIANSMGDVSENMHYAEIEERFGLLQELLPQEKKERTVPQDRGYTFHFKPHHRPPGMTEDGMERHRLAATAIIERGGRITLEDLAAVWLRDIDPEKFGYLLGPQDQIIYYSLKAGVPPWDVGRNAVWPSLIGTGKMMLTVGVVNACNPAQAAQDAFELGRIKDVRGVPGNYALEVAAGIAAGAAEALKPDSTVEGVVEAAMAYLSLAPRAEVDLGLQWAREASDWRELRAKYDEKYRGHRISNAVEMLSSGLALFVLADGDPERAIVSAVNLGRDTDCRAYICGGFSAAMRGIEALPARWVETIEAQLPSDPYTVSQRTLRESAEGLYAALLGNLEVIKTQAEQIERQIPAGALAHA